MNIHVNDFMPALFLFTEHGICQLNVYPFTFYELQF